MPHKPRHETPIERIYREVTGNKMPAVVKCILLPKRKTERQKMESPLGELIMLGDEWIRTLADGRRVAEALISISGSVRNTATLLEVLVATKIAPLTGLDPANV